MMSNRMPLALPLSVVSTLRVLTFAVMCLIPGLTSAQAFQQGFDFRNTSTFVTDPSGDTYVLPTTTYPTKFNGVTYGWVKTAPVRGRDRNAKLDPRLAGINFVNNGAPGTFYVDLPSPGTYNLSLAMGDAGNGQCWVQCQVQFLDGSTVLATVTTGVINLGYFYDATGKNWSAATWPSSNLSQQVTLTGSRLTVVVGTSKATGDVTPIAFLGVAQVSGSPNFTISASPAALSVAQGNQGTSTITTSISGGFNSAISLSASGQPSGTTVSFNPNPIPAPGGGSSTMSITVSSSTPTGTYPITVTGNGGGVQQNATVTLTVTAQQQPNFTLSASPASLSIQQGNQGTSTITTTISGGFNSGISLSASGQPAGTMVSFNPEHDSGSRGRQLDHDDHGGQQHADGKLSHHGDGQRRRHPAKHYGDTNGDGSGELHAIRLAGFAQRRARKPRDLHDYECYQRWLQQCDQSVGFGSAAGNDCELQSQPDTGAGLGHLDHDHHGGGEHACRDVSDHGDRQWRRNPAKHHGDADGALVVVGRRV